MVQPSPWCSPDPTRPPVASFTVSQAFTRVPFLLEAPPLLNFLSDISTEPHCVSELLSESLIPIRPRTWGACSPHGVRINTVNCVCLFNCLPQRFPNRDDEGSLIANSRAEAPRGGAGCVPSHTGPHARKGSALGWGLCCRHLESCNNFSKGPSRPCCTGPHKSRSWSLSCTSLARRQQLRG